MPLPAKSLRRACLAGAGLCLLALPAAAQPAQPVYREIRDWVLACDNTRACEAKAVPDELAAPAPDGDYEPGAMHIDRQAGAVGRLTVRFSLDDKAFDPAALRVDGKPLPAGARWTRADKGATASLEGDAALALIRQIRDGTTLTFSAAKGAPRVSLKGLAAVLLAMDEAQGRLGNTTALVKVGPAAATAVPAALPAPTVVAAPWIKPLADKARLIAVVRKSQGAALKAHECDAEPSTDDAAPLSADEAVVTLKCEIAAYQGSVLAFRTPVAAPGRAKLLILPTPPTVDPKVEPAGEYGDGDYDPKTATFTESAKGRGLADCGESATWTFDGRDFHLSRFNKQERCGGGEPGDWPTLYRTRVSPAR